MKNATAIYKKLSQRDLGTLHFNCLFNDREREAIKPFMMPTHESARHYQGMMHLSLWFNVFYWKHLHLATARHTKPAEGLSQTDLEGVQGYSADYLKALESALLVICAEQGINPATVRQFSGAGEIDFPKDLQTEKSLALTKEIAETFRTFFD